MWIVPWDLFLMKKLLNKEICGSHEQCTGPTEQCHSSKKVAALMIKLLRLMKKLLPFHWTHCYCSMGPTVWKRKTQTRRKKSVLKRILSVENWGLKKYTCLVTVFNKKRLSQNSQFRMFKHCILRTFIFQITVLSIIVVIILKIMRPTWCSQHIKHTFFLKTHIHTKYSIVFSILEKNVIETWYQQNTLSL